MICDGDTSVWYFYNLYVFQNGENCINYLDYNSDDVVAKYGTFDPDYPDDPNSPLIFTGVKDYGPLSSASHITTHYDQKEYDIRTGKGLKIIPDGSLAVVRLGNWDSSNGTESVTYYYTVDSISQLLLLQYALVLENPTDHDREYQPRFKLEVRDQSGNLIQGNCGKEDFYSGEDVNGWYRYGEVLWKPWTSFGVDLQPYVGERISITLTTYDCGWGGHYGYAYFTLDCAKAKITGTVCDDNSVDELRAPDGYSYVWFPKLREDSIVSLEQTFKPLPTDTGIFVCEMTYKQGCSFRLEASVTPRMVKSQYDYTIHYNNCRAEVEFVNTSYTYTKDGEIGECDSFRWEYGAGKVSTNKNITLIYDQSGYYPVTLSSELVNGECFDLFTDTIYIPDFSHQYDTLYIDICKTELPFEYGNKIYSSSGIFLAVDEKSMYSCDSILYINLQVNDTFNIVIEEELFLYKEPYYDFNGLLLSESGIYTHNLQSVTGCDSIVTLKLTAYPRLKTDIMYENFICPEQQIFIVDYTIHAGDFTTYSLLFDQTSHQSGFEDQLNQPRVPGQHYLEILLPEHVKSDIYKAKLIFEDIYSGNDTADIFITINYSDSILVQKWNDVIAILNSDYNGGYEFSEFQWYKNGLAIPGETRSYLYVPEHLDITAEYQVRITRYDGVSLFTCPFTPENREEITVYPTVINTGENIIIEMPVRGNLFVWNIMGLNIMNQLLNPSENIVSLPVYPGTYFLFITDEQQEKRVYTILVK